MANCIQCGRKLPPFSLRKICQWCVQHEAAQRGEDAGVQRVMPTPWVRRESSISLTHVIFGANLAVFIAMVMATNDPLAFLDPTHGFSGEQLVHWGAIYGPYTLGGDWWRLLTYMFLHGHLLHIGMNMWCLWNLGPLCEALYGRWTYLTLYILSGVAGGLVSLGWNPGVLTVGASGAIFGLTGALIASLTLGKFSLTGISTTGTLSSLLFFAGFSLYLGVVSPEVDNACHVGGLFCGLILGGLIATVAPERDQSFQRVGILAFVALVLLSSAVGVQRWRGFAMRSSRVLTEGTLDRVITDLQKRIRKNPQDASAHYSLAHGYLALGRVPQAESELKRVLELQPQYASARMDLGAVYLNNDQPQEAQAQFAKLAADDPNNTRAHIGLGMALARQQNHEAAVKEFKLALQQDPQAGGVYYSMGLSQAQLRQYDEAIASYTQERTNSGDDAALENALAEAYQAKGMMQQAEAARAKAAQLKSGQQN